MSDNRGGTRRICGEGIGDSGPVTKVFRAVRKTPRIGVPAANRCEKRIITFRGDAIQSSFGDGWFGIGGQNRKQLGKIFGRKFLRAGNDVYFLFQRRVAGSNRRSKFGANGSLRGRLSDPSE